MSVISYLRTGTWPAAVPANDGATIEALNDLTNQWMAGRLSASAYVPRAEAIARFLALSGGEGEICRLAAVLEIKALTLREQGGPPAEMFAAEVECLKILDRLADGGSDLALGQLGRFTALASPYALGRALEERLDEAAPAGPPSIPAPTSPPATLSLGDNAEPTRREIIRGWFEDRYWDFRSWLSNRWWWVETRLWWPIEDMFDRWRSR